MAVIKKCLSSPRALPGQHLASFTAFRVGHCPSCGTKNDRFTPRCGFGSESALEQTFILCFFPALATTWKSQWREKTKQKLVSCSWELGRGVLDIRYSCSPHQGDIESEDNASAPQQQGGSPFHAEAVIAAPDCMHVNSPPLSHPNLWGRVGD